MKRQSTAHGLDLGKPTQKNVLVISVGPSALKIRVSRMYMALMTAGYHQNKVTTLQLQRENILLHGHLLY